MKADQVIDAEVIALVRMLPHVLRTSRDNHAAVRAQIVVLRARLARPTIHSRYGKEPAVCKAALEAAEWMRGHQSARAVSPASDAATLCEPSHTFDPYQTS